MKKFYMLLLMVFMLSISATTYAYNDEDDVHNKQPEARYDDHADSHNDHHNWSHAEYDKWQHVEHYHGNLPFKWYDHRSSFSNHSGMVRIYHRGWNDHFPGLVSYKWRNDEGFWYHGRRIHDAVLFYDHEDRLVSVGFRHDDAFIVIRDDDSSYRNHDSFFLSWSDENLNIRIRD